MLSVIPAIHAQHLQEFFWACAHPKTAIKIQALKKQADVIYESYSAQHLPDNYASGGKLDAFRHVFYMAVFAQVADTVVLRKLGNAHERDNYKQFKRSKDEHGELPNAASQEMDLHNNALGFKLGKANTSLSKEALATITLQWIAEGYALQIKRDCSGNYLDCNGQLVQKTHKHWRTTHCLVPSNYTCIP